ncbi:cell wall-binding repeat-containing protein [Salana multivorans]
MGKATRRGVIAASAAAAALIIAPTAFAGAPYVVPDIPQALDKTLDGNSGNQARFFRFASATPVETALFAAENTSGWGNVAILASSYSYADALAAAPVAETYNAPILLANEDGSLNPQVKAHLAGYDWVVIVSGPNNIPEATKDALNAQGNTTVRLSGVDRYQTATILAAVNIVTSTEDPSSGQNFILTDGENFPDALTTGPAAAKTTNGSLLLTYGSQGIPAPIYGFLTTGAISFSSPTVTIPLPNGGVYTWDPSNWNWNQNHRTITVVGGAARASAGVGLLGGDSPRVEYTDQLVGADRYDTSALVANKYFTNSAEYFTLSTGTTFPETVVAGGWAANANGPLLLTTHAELSPAAEAYLNGGVVKRSQPNGSVVNQTLTRHGNNSSKFVVFGGTETVSKSVSQRLQKLFTY